MYEGALIDVENEDGGVDESVVKLRACALISGIQGKARTATGSLWHVPEVIRRAMTVWSKAVTVTSFMCCVQIVPTSPAGRRAIGWATDGMRRKQRYRKLQPLMAVWKNEGAMKSMPASVQCVGM